MSHHIIAKLTPKPGSEAQLREAMDAMVGPSRAEAGCQQYDAYQSETGQVIVVERWDDEAALGIHSETEHMATFRAAIGELLAGPVVIEKTSPIAP